MIVLDASALVDVVLDQPASGWVLEQMVGHEVCAPAHQPAEVISALARLTRSGTLADRAADEALDEATTLAQELVLPTPEHLRRAMQWRHRIRVLDGLYVALAHERGSPLLTTDLRLGHAHK